MNGVVGIIVGITVIMSCVGVDYVVACGVRMYAVVSIVVACDCSIDVVIRYWLRW